MPRPLHPPSPFIPSTVRWHVFLHVCLMSAAVRRLAGSLLDPPELCHVIRLAAGMPERRHSVNALQNEKFLLGRSPAASDVAPVQR